MTCLGLGAWFFCLWSVGLSARLRAPRGRPPAHGNGACACECLRPPGAHAYFYFYDVGNQDPEQHFLFASACLGSLLPTNPSALHSHFFCLSLPISQIRCTIGWPSLAPALSPGIVCCCLYSLYTHTQTHAAHSVSYRREPRGRSTTALIMPCGSSVGKKMSGLPVWSLFSMRNLDMSKGMLWMLGCCVWVVCGGNGGGGGGGG